MNRSSLRATRPAANISSVSGRWRAICAPAILAGSDVRRGARDAGPLDHYGTLATVERALGLPLLAGAAGQGAGDLDRLFTHPPHLR